PRAPSPPRPPRVPRTPAPPPRVASSPGRLEARAHPTADRRRVARHRDLERATTDDPVATAQHDRRIRPQPLLFAIPGEGVGFEAKAVGRRDDDVAAKLDLLLLGQVLPLVADDGPGPLRLLDLDVDAPEVGTARPPLVVDQRLLGRQPPTHLPRFLLDPY